MATVNIFRCAVKDIPLQKKNKNQTQNKDLAKKPPFLNTHS